MNGTSVSSTAALPTANTSWWIKGVADFNIDGDDDIMWRRPDAGKNLIWYMDGTSLLDTGWSNDAPEKWDRQGMGAFH